MKYQFAPVRTNPKCHEGYQVCGYVVDSRKAALLAATGNKEALFRARDPAVATDDWRAVRVPVDALVSLETEKGLHRVIAAVRLAYDLWRAK